MRGSASVNRTLTIAAVAFLTFDGAAIAVLGLITGRMTLVPVGLVFFASAGLVLVYWRSQQRRSQEIAAERKGLAELAREMQRLPKK